MTTAERIAAARHRHGWTQVQLAERLGTSSLMVSQWETGHRTPSARWIVKLCDVLDCSADWLLCRTD